jgi:hypothetical protein
MWSKRREAYKVVGPLIPKLKRISCVECDIWANIVIRQTVVEDYVTNPRLEMRPMGVVERCVVCRASPVDPMQWQKTPVSKCVDIEVLSFLYERHPSNEDLRRSLDCVMGLMWWYPCARNKAMRLIQGLFL